MSPETKAKIKRDAKAYGLEHFDDMETTDTEHFSAGAKPWAEMCEELERALEWQRDRGKSCGDDEAESMAEVSLSKLAAFREGKI